MPLGKQCRKEQLQHLLLPSDYGIQLLSDLLNLLKKLLIRHDALPGFLQYNLSAS